MVIRISVKGKERDKIATLYVVKKCSGFVVAKGNDRSPDNSNNKYYESSNKKELVKSTY